MTHSTSFDLNRAIQNWRDEIGQSPAFGHENLDELESHLRDSISALQGRGLSVEEAFVIGTRRVGKGSSLETEYRKVNGQNVWLDRILWMLIGLQVWTVVSAIVGRFFRGALILAFAQYDIHAHGRALPLLAFILLQSLIYVGSVWVCWWLIIRKGKRLANWFANYLKRPLHLVGMCLLLWLLSTAALFLGQIFQVFSLRSSTPEVAGELNMSLSISTSWVHIAAAAAMIAFTLVLARKRLASNRTLAAE